MVSTRQMATNSNGGAGGSCSSSSSNDETTTRLSVVTRQSSGSCSTTTNNMGANCSTAAIVTSTSAAVATAVATAVMTTRHHHHHMHLTQAVKTQVTTAVTGAATTAAAATASVTTINTNSSSTMHLLDLPTEILSKIFSYADYKRIGQLRVVSQKVNDVCMYILNSTFSKLITQTYNHFHAIKASMPRRESARRNHPLACECDIIETCYMRLSLLQMTIGKHIERGHCCFFPGAILDEVYIILNYIKNTPYLERPYRVTDELFDLSTMAMEYFRDRIEPTLPGIAYFNKDFFKLPTTTKRPALVIASDLSDSSTSLPSPPQSNMVLRKGIRKIKQGMKMYNNQLSVLRNELRTCKRKSAEQGKQIAEQQKLLAEQQKQTLEYANRLDENDKKNEEMARKFSTLLQELNKCKTELQYWRSKSPAMPACATCGQKVVPVLPPEDYQALINQGVKPEDIILNLNDDTDADESDASLCESNLTLSNEFVFPDEATTAKLLAVNTATKNLKRQYHHHSQHHFQSHAAVTVTAAAANAVATTANASSNSITNTNNTSNNINNENNLIDGDVKDQATAAARTTATNSSIGDGPSEMTQCLVYAVKGEQIMKSNYTNAIVHYAPAAATVAAGTTTTQPQYTTNNDKDLNVSNSNDMPSENMNAASMNATGGTTDCDDGNSAGYSTKLFYGTNVHKSVIVSPIITEQQRCATTTAIASDLTEYQKQQKSHMNTVAGAAGSGVVIGNSDGVAGGGGGGNGDGIGGNDVIGIAATTDEDVVALYAIKSHETKKARRVQKATRCASASGSKRSK